MLLCIKLIKLFFLKHYSLLFRHDQMNLHTFSSGSYHVYDMSHAVYTMVDGAVCRITGSFSSSAASETA